MLETLENLSPIVIITKHNQRNNWNTPAIWSIIFYFWMQGLRENLNRIQSFKNKYFLLKMSSHFTVDKEVFYSLNSLSQIDNCTDLQWQFFDMLSRAFLNPLTCSRAPSEGYEWNVRVGHYSLPNFTADTKHHVYNTSRQSFKTVYSFIFYLMLSVMYLQNTAIFPAKAFFAGWIKFKSLTILVRIKLLLICWPILVNDSI